MSLEKADAVPAAVKRYGWFMKAARDTRTASHMLMTGGKYAIPDAELDAFYDALATDLSSPGNRLFIIERHTSVFCLYYDIDLRKEPADRHGAIYDAFIAMVRDTVPKFFDPTTPGLSARLCDVLVLSNGRATAGGVAEPGDGYHVYLPNMFVDRDKAEAIRYVIVKRLQHAHRDLASWADVVDAAVYANGLRMPGCAKAGDCPACKAKTGRAMPQCPGGCDSRGRVSLGRVYRYYGYLSSLDAVDAPAESAGVLSTEDLRQRLSGNWAFLLRACCLRPRGPDGTCASAQPTPGFRLYQGCPVVLNERRRNFKNELPGGDTAYRLLEDLLHSMGPQYAELDVDKIALTGKNSTIALAFVSGHNATYCPNISGCHKSARTFFYITPSGLQQRCGCKCDTTQGRSGGVPCSKWKSLVRPINPQLAAALFPAVSISRSGLAGCAVTAPTSPLEGTTPRRGSFIDRATRSGQITPMGDFDSGSATPVGEPAVGAFLTRSCSLPQMEQMACVTARLHSMLAAAKGGKGAKQGAPRAPRSSQSPRKRKTPE